MNKPVDLQLIFHRPWLRRFVLLGILALAFGIRLMDLTDLPLDFHAPRQLYSAKRARGMYFQQAQDVPDWQRRIAYEQWQSTPKIEPPILETLIACTYHLTGPELWVGRLFSIAFWILGGLAIYSLASRLTTWEGGILSLAFYLFLPFGIIASRSIQPDPLMVASFAGYLWALERWSHHDTWKRMLVAGLLGGFAVLVKTTAIFFVGGALAGIALGLWGLRRAMRSSQLWMMAVLIILPSVVYNFYGLFLTGDLLPQVGGRFAASLLLDPIFYLNWAGKVDQVVGTIPFMLAILGIVFFTRGKDRGLVAGLWIGYILYGLVFNYHNATHDYYQLPLIPVAALSLAPLIVPVIDRLVRIWDQKWLPALVVVLVLTFSLLMLGWNARRTLRRVDYRPQAEFWASIGETLGYESRVIGLTADYGASLEYWGWKSIETWQSTGDLAYHEVFGETPGSFTDRFATSVAGKDFFLVTDLAELARQPELKAHLEQHFPLYAQGSGYLIYELESQP